MRLLLISILFFIWGCSSTSTVEKPSLVTTLTPSWKLSGKIASVYDDLSCYKEVCPKKSDQGQLIWQQNNNYYHVKILDPFGRILYEIKGNNKLATIQTNNDVYNITDPQDFINKQLKIDVSPKTLVFWLTGRPDPDFISQVSSDSSFKQKGIDIKVNKWMNTRKGVLPKIITINDGSNYLKIAVKTWE